MSISYATQADLAIWGLTTLPSPADSYLRSATMLVRSATKSAVYDVDENGLPSDPIILRAFNDATCAQVEYWQASGVNPMAGGVTFTDGGQLASRSEGARAEAFFADSDAFKASRREAAMCLCRLSTEILAANGMLNRHPGIR